MGNFNITDPVTWEFMDEPFWKWVLFLIALGLAMNAWNGILSYMKS